MSQKSHEMPSVISDHGEALGGAMTVCLLGFIFAIFDTALEIPVAGNGKTVMNERQAPPGGGGGGGHH